LSDDTTRILLIDDDEMDAEMTRAMLGQISPSTMEMDWAATFAEGLAALETGAYDVFLVDYFLEDGTGLQLLREARSRHIRTPMIMLTGKGSRDVDVEAMKVGAADYLVKGTIGPDDLERSIRYALDRARAQKELRESEERHRGMFDHLPIGLYRCRPDGGFLDANPALVRMLGFPDPAELRDRYAATFYVGPDDATRFRRRLDEEGVVRGFESWVTGSDGEPRRLRNTARIHRTPDGTVQYLEGAVEDVTASSSQLRLREESARYRAVIEGLPVALLAVDRDGRIMDASPAFQEAWKHGATDLLMRDLADLVHPDDVAAVRTSMQQALEGDVGAGWRVACRLLCADGEPRAARLTLSPVVDGEGDADHILVLVRERDV
jgi:PAS domain S-box-containing protein